MNAVSFILLKEYSIPPLKPCAITDADACQLPVQYHPCRGTCTILKNALLFQINFCSKDSCWAALWVPSACSRDGIQYHFWCTCYRLFLGSGLAPSIFHINPATGALGNMMHDAEHKDSCLWWDFQHGYNGWDLFHRNLLLQEPPAKSEKYLQRKIGQMQRSFTLHLWKVL